MSDPDYCLSVIESTFNAAHGAGAGLFAWSNSPRPHMRSSAYPWALRGFVAGVFGVVCAHLKPQGERSGNPGR